MIVREIVERPNLVHSFDYFNDYKDTANYLGWEVTMAKATLEDKVGGSPQWESALIYHNHIIDLRKKLFAGNEAWHQADMIRIRKSVQADKDRRVKRDAEWDDLNYPDPNTPLMNLKTLQNMNTENKKKPYKYGR